jgi:hypothetical protein
LKTKTTPTRNTSRKSTRTKKKLVKPPTTKKKTKMRKTKNRTMTKKTTRTMTTRPKIEEEDGPPLYVHRPAQDRSVNTNHARPFLAAASAKALPAASLATAPAEARQSADNSHSETPVALDALRKRVRKQILAEARQIAEAVGFDFHPRSPRPK